MFLEATPGRAAGEASGGEAPDTANGGALKDGGEAMNRLSQCDSDREVFECGGEGTTRTRSEDENAEEDAVSPTKKRPILKRPILRRQERAAVSDAGDGQWAAQQVR